MKQHNTFFKTVIISLFTFVGMSFANEHKQQTILFTHDLHDHFLSISEFENGNKNQVGGYAKLKTAIDLEKKLDPNALVLDGGDYSMGTLFQSIYKSESPGLRVLGQMGYDVTTLGNHEFDFRAEGLAQSLQSALKSQEKLPSIVQANMYIPLDEKKESNAQLLELKNAIDAYGIKPYTIIEKNQLKIGVFGLMGKEAASNAPMSGVTFSDPIKSAKNIVKRLKEDEKVDMIICLSHSGTSSNPKQSEDEILAQKVPEIDIIISGHTHSVLEEPLVIRDTLIVSGGEYARALGVLKVAKTSKGRWKWVDYDLKLLDESIQENEEILQTINKFKQKVQTDYLDTFNLGFDEILTHTSFDFIDTQKIGSIHKEEPLGNLISDAYKYAVKKIEGNNYEPIAAAIVPVGTIRGSFSKGPITVSDAFTVSSLGIGADGISGYPLVSAYLTGKEIKTVCEVDTSVTPLMPPAQLYISGLSYEFNPNRMIFDKVIDIKLINEDGRLQDLQDDQLYRVVAGLYSAQMLSVVGDISFGILPIVPKTKQGIPIKNFEDYIIKESHENTELKEWLAIAQYLQSFDPIEGVPIKYSATEGRKRIDQAKDFRSIFKNISKLSGVIYIILAAVFVSFVALIVWGVKYIKRVK